MKGLLVVLALVLVGGGGWYYYNHQESLGPAIEAGNPTPADAVKPAPKHGFGEVSAKLQADMSKVPTDLRQPRQIPASAFDTRSKLERYVQLHQEYRTLTSVCDVIIGIDQECGERQSKCGITPLVTTGGKVARAESLNPALYQQQETIWVSHRAAADTEVRRLLDTLRNSQL